MEGGAQAPNFGNVVAEHSQKIMFSIVGKYSYITLIHPNSAQFAPPQLFLASAAPEGSILLTVGYVLKMLLECRHH